VKEEGCIGQLGAVRRRVSGSEKWWG